jgi:2-dehydro-3-deoxy-D-arabinonate dehydratase
MDIHNDNWKDDFLKSSVLKYFCKRNEVNSSLLVSSNHSSLFLEFPDIKDFLDLYYKSFQIDMDVDSFTKSIIKDSKGLTPDSEDKGIIVYELDDDRVLIGPPLLPKEVWAAGVTYSDSMRERQAESETPDVYAKVYNAERPEIFFKATQDRIQGPFDEVGIRTDSGWDVPEAELALVIISGQITGFTIGNDMSSRLIEGENPLYLPQAKMYEKSCSIGPCIVSSKNINDPQNLDVYLQIIRSEKQVFEGKCSTSQMKRTCEEIVDWLQRHNQVPDGTIVLTGTGIIPPQDFTLKENDLIKIQIETIGELVNKVVRV